MLPNIITKSGIRKTNQVRFGGLDLRPEAGDGTFLETIGLNMERLPFLTPREHWLSTQLSELTAMVGMGNHLVCAAGEYGGIFLDGLHICNAETSKAITKLVPFGSRLVLPETREIVELRYPIIGKVQRADELPDTETEGNAWLVGDGRPELWLWQSGAWVDAGPLIESLERSVGPLPMIFRDGSCQGEEAKANTLEINPNLWLMPNVDPAQLPKFSDYFQPGDAVTISGCYGRPENNLTLIVREVSERELRFYENSFMQSVGQFTVGQDGLNAGLYECTGWFQVDKGRSGTEPRVFFQVPNGTSLQAGDYIQYINPTISQFNPNSYSYIEAYVQWFHKDGTAYQGGTAELSASWSGDSATTPTKLPFVETEDRADIYHGELNVTVSKKWPEGIEGLFADSNRLWGWQGNQIRACKLGDPSNWEFFDGTAEDAWAVEVQRPGAFTGGISANGYPTFFKEDLRIRVYGSQPSEFSTSEQDCSGVRAGCAGSMVILDESLFYVSRLGVMQDSGSIPFLISQALGDLRLVRAVAAAKGNTLWVSATGEDNVVRLLCYDKSKGVWILDSYGRFDLIAEAGGVLFAGPYDGDELVAMQCSAPTSFPPWRWAPMDEPFEGERMMLRTNLYTMDQPNRKRVHRIQIRARAEGAATLRVLIQYDSDGAWSIVKLAQWQDGECKSVYLPVLPRRCDHFQLQFEAVGQVEIMSLAMEIKSGSPIH